MLRDVAGTTAFEAALLVTLVALVALASFQLLGERIDVEARCVATALSGGGGCDDPPAVAAGTTAASTRLALEERLAGLDAESRQDGLEDLADDDTIDDATALEVLEHLDEVEPGHRDDVVLDVLEPYGDEPTGVPSEIHAAVLQSLGDVKPDDRDDILQELARDPVLDRAETAGILEHLDECGENADDVLHRLVERDDLPAKTEDAILLWMVATDHLYADVAETILERGVYSDELRPIAEEIAARDDGGCGFLGTGCAARAVAGAADWTWDHTGGYVVAEVDDFRAEAWRAFTDWVDPRDDALDPPIARDIESGSREVFLGGVDAVESYARGEPIVETVQLVTACASSPRECAHTVSHLVTNPTEVLRAIAESCMSTPRGFGRCAADFMISAAIGGAMAPRGVASGLFARIWRGLEGPTSPIDEAAYFELLEAQPWDDAAAAGLADREALEALEVELDVAASELDIELDEEGIQLIEEAFESPSDDAVQAAAELDATSALAQEIDETFAPSLGGDLLLSMHDRFFASPSLREGLELFLDRGWRIERWDGPDARLDPVEMVLYIPEDAPPEIVTVDLLFGIARSRPLELPDPYAFASEEAFVDAYVLESLENHGELQLLLREVAHELMDANVYPVATRTAGPDLLNDAFDEAYADYLVYGDRAQALENMTELTRSLSEPGSSSKLGDTAEYWARRLWANTRGADEP